MAEKKKSRRGFASMCPEKQREIASMGGRAVQAKGTAHCWTSEEAKSAGRKGGLETMKGRGSDFYRALARKRWNKQLVEATV